MYLLHERHHLIKFIGLSTWRPITGNLLFKMQDRPYGLKLVYQKASTCNIKKFTNWVCLFFRYFAWVFRKIWENRIGATLPRIGVTGKSCSYPVAQPSQYSELGSAVSVFGTFVLHNFIAPCSTGGISSESVRVILQVGIKRCGWHSNPLDNHAISPRIDLQFVVQQQE